MIEAPDSLASDVVELLNEALEWRLIGLLFERPRESWTVEVRELIPSCHDAGLTDAALRSRDTTEESYLAFLGPAGLVSPREAGYRRTTDPAQVLSEICAFHRAFAFESVREDPVDHIAVLAGFVGWLRLKEAFARANSDLESAEITRAAAERFVENHITSWAEPLATKLEAHDAGPLALAARALAVRVGAPARQVEGDWVPVGLGVEGCTLSCASEASGEEEAGELPPEFTAGLPYEIAHGPD